MGGRKLWEAKDEKPWVHDLFEEFNNLGHDHFAGEVYSFVIVGVCRFNRNAGCVQIAPLRSYWIDDECTGPVVED